MSSCVLYHGPGAKEAALAEAGRLGRLVAPPFGESGLKVDDARQVVELLAQIPVGEHLGVVVVGPMDEANPKAADTLLKSIEESTGQYTQAIMWSNDLGGVSPTIRSRCLDRWAPASLGGEDDETLLAGAYKLIEALEKRDVLLVVDTARQFEKREVALLGALSEVLATNLDNAQYRQVWERLRKVATYKNPWMAEILVALLGVEGSNG